jgi:hypothetical protein
MDNFNHKDAKNCPLLTKEGDWGRFSRGNATECLILGRSYGTPKLGIHHSPDFFVPPGLRIRGYNWVVPLAGLLDYFHLGARSPRSYNGTVIFRTVVQKKLNILSV